MGHYYANLLDSPLELIKVDLSSVLDIKVLELLVEELGLINVVGVLLVDLVTKLHIKSKH